MRTGAAGRTPSDLRGRVICTAGLQPKLGKRESPGWRELVEFHGFLGNDIESAKVKEIRDLRHLLTHQRGKLRSEQQRLRFRDEAAEAGVDFGLQSYVGGSVFLGGKRVLAALDDLAAVVRQADKTIWLLV